MLVFELALETAMCLREIYKLTAVQVDLQRRTIFLFKTKNGDTRQLPLSSRALMVLSEVPSEGLIFPWTGTQHFPQL